MKDSRKKLGKHGRIILRYSGTENVIRAMIEGENESLVNNMMHELVALIETRVRQ